MSGTWGASWLGSWAASWGYSDSPQPSPVVSKGGIGFDEKSYRKYLERLEKATRTQEIRQDIIDLAKKVADESPIEIKIPEIEKLASAEGEIDTYAIDYQALASEIIYIKSYIDEIEGIISLRKSNIRQELDDELALLLMIN